MTERVAESDAAVERERDRAFEVHESIMHALEHGVPGHFQKGDIEVLAIAPNEWGFRPFVRTVKESALLSWIEARDAVTEGNQGINEMAFLCAVDGLRRDPGEGEERTIDWRHYADNLAIGLRDPILPPEFFHRERDPLVVHVHAVRCMYRLLQRPEEIRSALTRFFYGSRDDDDDRWKTSRCFDKFLYRVFLATIEYHEVMNEVEDDSSGLERMRAVANHLDLPLDSILECEDEKNCIVCGGSSTWGGHDWPVFNEEDRRKERRHLLWTKRRTNLLFWTKMKKLVGGRERD